MIFQLSLAAVHSDRVQGFHLLREECLSEMRRHPGKLVSGWWRALRFVWAKNTPFRSVFPEMPSVWFIEFAIGGILTLVIVFASWCLPGTTVSKNRQHPVRLMLDGLTGQPALVSSVDLRSLRAGYHLRLSDDTHPTWLPNISRKGFVQNVPRLMGYLTFSQAFNQLPAGSEVVVLPYWTLLVLDKEDAQEHRFTPQPEQMGHVVWAACVF